MLMRGMILHQTQPHQNLADYLTVGEAAAFLGVFSWTLRNWDNDGKLKRCVTAERLPVVQARRLGDCPRLEGLRGRR